MAKVMNYGKKGQWQKIGTIGVDSGTLCIQDPCYDEDDPVRDIMFKIMNDNNYSGHVRAIGYKAPDIESMTEDMKKLLSPDASKQDEYGRMKGTDRYMEINTGGDGGFPVSVKWGSGGVCEIKIELPHNK